MKKIFVLTIALHINSCGYKDTSINSDTNQALKDPNIAAVDFATVQRVVFQPYCVRCHSQAGGNRGGINLETYAAAKSAAQMANSAVQSGSMPPSGTISPAAKTTLATWVQAGAPQASGEIAGPAPAPAPAPSPAPAPVPAPVPCAVYNHQINDGRIVNVDSFYFFDVKAETLKRRNDDCHPEHD